MKRLIPIIGLIFATILTGCGVKTPTKTVAGTPWDSRWDNVGSLMGVEPADGWTLSRSEDVLAAEGTFYNVWVKGDSFTYPGADDQTITAYEGQVHLVATQKESSHDARDQASQWDTLITERYPDAVSAEAEYAGQSFGTAVYDFPAGERTLHGASATAVRGNWAIHLDVISAEESAQAVLEAFLIRCHWAE